MNTQTFVEALQQLRFCIEQTGSSAYEFYRACQSPYDTMIKDLTIEWPLKRPTNQNYEITFEQAIGIDE